MVMSVGGLSAFITRVLRACPEWQFGLIADIVAVRSLEITRRLN